MKPTARLMDTLDLRRSWQVDMQRERLRPLRSLTAAAQRVVSTKIARNTTVTHEDWQSDAWSMYDLVGEQRFIASTISRRLSQAALYVGELSDDQRNDPRITDDPNLSAILDAVGGSFHSVAGMLERMSLNLFMAGEFWLVGIHPGLFTDTPIKELSLDDVALADLDWRVLSVDELTIRNNTASLSIGDSRLSGRNIPVDLLYTVRCWRPHPRFGWRADSPTRSALPVLRELVALTMHISAQVDSRLAGAGVLIVPASADEAMRQRMGTSPDSDDDPFTDSLMQAMLTPISDRSAASAVVPLVVTVPDSSIEHFRHITFTSELDAEARPLRDEAIRRLALSQDAPPELLLGTAGMNHWGAWLVRDDTVTMHIEPPLALICDALTAQYLHPVMRSLNYSEAQIARTVIWYDVSKLIARPNKSSDAERLYDKGVLSPETLREAAGFDESDAPTEVLGAAERIAIEIVGKAPSLLDSRTMTELRDEISALMDTATGDSGATSRSSSAPQTRPVGDIPNTRNDDATR